METKFKNVLITGASSGIGEAMALYYAASGSENLFICGRNKERLNEVKHQCEKFGAKVYASLIDVNDREKMRAWINQSNKKAALNLVLANAGVATIKENDEALRVYLAPKDIQISVICPGFVKSRITDKNTCPMPFFMPAEKAAGIIGRGLENNVGLIAFPWPMRLAVWFLKQKKRKFADSTIFLFNFSLFSFTGL